MTDGTKNLDDILRKVQGLIAKADHPNTSPTEAATFRAKAEAMMFKYRIDETLTAKASGADTLKPVFRTIRVSRKDSEFNEQYRTMAGYVLYHFDVRSGWGTVWDSELGEEWTIFTACGYDSDLRFAEALITSAVMAFGNKLEPKMDPTLSEQVNAYNMRSAGMEGSRIVEAIYGTYTKAACPKVRGMFKKEAILRGEDPAPLMGHGMKTFRKSYADGFVSEFWDRLYRMRANRQMNEHGLVLAGRTDAIAEAWYEKFPYLRPRPVAGSIGNEQAECAKCAKAKSGYCKEHAWMKPTKAPATKVNYEAERRGRDAARTIDIGGTKAI